MNGKFGGAVLELRNSLGMSRQKLAAQLGNISMATIQRWESDEFRPNAASLPKLYRIARDNGRYDLAKVFMGDGLPGDEKGNPFLYLVVNGNGKVIDTFISAESAEAELFVGHRIFRRKLQSPLEEIEATPVSRFIGGEQ